MCGVKRSSSFNPVSLAQAHLWSEPSQPSGAGFIVHEGPLPAEGEQFRKTPIDGVHELAEFLLSVVRHPVTRFSDAFVRDTIELVSLSSTPMNTN